jgi:hypothetical protein
VYFLCQNWFVKLILFFSFTVSIIFLLCVHEVLSPLLFSELLRYCFLSDGIVREEAVDMES